MKKNEAVTEARANPQAYACLGLTFISGLIGIVFAVFLTDIVARVCVSAAGLVGFVAGVAGHSYFKKKQLKSGFRPSARVRRLIGYAFALSIIAAVVFVPFAVAARDFGYLILPVGYAIGMFPLVRALISQDEGRDQP